MKYRSPRCPRLSHNLNVPKLDNKDKADLGRCKFLKIIIMRYFVLFLSPLIRNAYRFVETM